MTVSRTPADTFWLRNRRQTYKQLVDTIEVDVVIVGGGIAGLSVAYICKRAGLRVAVIEKHILAAGTTGGTTGKVTYQHGLLYDELISKFGNRIAQYYADVHQTAFSDISKLIKREKINCSWVKEDNFVFTNNPKKVASFKKEAAAACSLGLSADFIPQVDLPFSTKGAVRFANQARFDAVAYVHGLAKAVHGNGSFVFEDSEFTHLRYGDPATVKTKHGSVTAHSVVIATKIPPAPLGARLTYAAIEYPQTSYVVSGKAKVKVTGMYISPDKGHYSIQPVDEERLLVGGEAHIPGIGLPSKHYRALENYSEKYFGIKKFDFQWKEMDYVAYDKLPVIGRLYPGSKNVYVVSGFKKWGLCTSMVAAKIIADHIADPGTRKSNYFDPHRKSAPLAIPKAVFEYLSK